MADADAADEREKLDDRQSRTAFAAGRPTRPKTLVYETPRSRTRLQDFCVSKTHVRNQRPTIGAVCGF
jgi:hypothetical protein